MWLAVWKLKNSKRRRSGDSVRRLIGMLVTVLFVPTAYALIARGSGSPSDVARRLEAEEQQADDAAAAPAE